MGNKKSETRTSGYEASWDYNAQGKVVRETKTCSYGQTVETPTVTHYTYDTMGNVTSETVCAGAGATAPVLSHKRYSYNGLGKVAEEKATVGLIASGFELLTYDLVDDPGYDALAGVETTVSYTYLCDGLVSTRTRENTYGSAEFPSPDQHVYYSYEHFGKKTLERWLNGDTPYEKSWVYDGAGNVMLEAVGSGEDVRPTAYEYDGAGRVTKTIVPQAGSEGLAGRTLTFAYDGRGRLTAEGAEDGFTQVALITYAYDNTGGLTQAEEGANQVDLSYEPASGSLSSVTSTAGGQSYETSYQYLQSGELSLRQTEAGATTYAYDVAGRLTSVTDPSENTISLEWDECFRLHSLTLPEEEGHIDYTCYRNGAVHTQKAYATMDELDPQASFTHTYDERGKRQG
jgi:YD repeat-containing protein